MWQGAPGGSGARTPAGLGALALGAGRGMRGDRVPNRPLVFAIVHPNPSTYWG